MFDDLLDNAKKTDAIFKWADKNEDKKLSNEEKKEFKNNFFTGISKLDTKGDNNITSLDELAKAITGLGKGKNSNEYKEIAELFPQYTNPKEAAGGGGGGGGWGDYTGGGGGGGDNTTPTEKTDPVAIAFSGLDTSKDEKYNKEQYNKNLEGMKETDLKTGRETAETQIKDLQSKQTKAQTAYETAVTNRTNADKEYANKYKDLQGKNQDLDTAYTTYETAQSDVASKNEEYQKAQENLEKKQKEFDKNEEEIARLESMLKGCNDEGKKAQLQGELEGYKTTRKDLSGDLGYLTMVCLDKYSSRSQAYKTLSSAAEGLNKATSNLNEAKDDVKKAAQNVAACAKAEADASDSLTAIESSIQYYTTVAKTYAAELLTRATKAETQAQGDTQAQGETAAADNTPSDTPSEDKTGAPKDNAVKEKVKSTVSTVVKAVAEPVINAVKEVGKAILSFFGADKK